ncbi:MAG TPA: DUF1598 domain-containing protein [Pirellulales bacterium]|nr:DUF1598 domain-containing protein [Pirellulales bacterium]
MSIEFSTRRFHLGLTACGWAGMVAGGLVALALVALDSLQAAEPEGEELLREQLAAGEFAPALKSADAAPPNERDRWLSSIAQAQAGAGEKSGSLSTAGQIRDDLTRDRTLDDVMRQPPGGAQGGGGTADFQSLIELITSTIAPTSWDEVGGPGAIQEYRNGVYVDTLGVVRRIAPEDLGNGPLAKLRRSAERRLAADDVRRASPLRKISLPRLEREIQLRMAAGRPLDEEMSVLAGLQRIKYVLIYPETGDLVLAGPAGDWKLDRENRLASSDTGRPVVQLDDLVLLLRHVSHSRDGEFGCSINPTDEGLAKAQAFLQESSKKPIKAGGRGKWLEQLRSQLGRQTIEVFGIDPRSRVAHAIVEADYRMKLVGIGLEKGTLDVPSYLESIKVPAGQAPPPMNVLRWWFTVNYDAVKASRDRDVYELNGQGVKVLSENELLAAGGKRIHMGESDELNSQFAYNFTKHFPELAVKYPVYADLQNIFDLALTASLIKAEGLADRVGWHMLAFGDPERYPLAQGHAPAAVETVVNHRVVNRVHVLAAVSGGVTADCSSLVKDQAIQLDGKGALGSERERSKPEQVAHASWWWD